MTEAYESHLPEKQYPAGTVFVRLPENLDLIALVQDHHPICTIPGFKMDKLLYLASIIYTKFSELRGGNFVHPQYQKNTNRAFFIPLSSKVLAECLGDQYKSYVALLLDAGIITIDTSYTTGEKCYGYKIAEQYRTNAFKRVAITDFVLARKIREGLIEQSKRDHAHVTAMRKRIPYLSMDAKKARVRIMEMEDSALTELEGRELTKKKRFKEERKIHNRFFRYACIIADFEDGNYYRCKRNADHYRFYSIVTGLPKPLRDLVTCKGKPLVQVDLTNAQFMMSLKLLMPDTWQNRTKGKLHKRIWKDLACLKAGYTETAELVSILKYQDLEDLPYTQLLMDGKLYESLIDQFVAAGHVEDHLSHRDKRKAVKNLLIVSMFDNTKPR